MQQKGVIRTPTGGAEQNSSSPSTTTTTSQNNSQVSFSPVLLSHGNVNKEGTPSCTDELQIPLESASYQQQMQNNHQQPQGRPSLFANRNNNEGTHSGGPCQDLHFLGVSEDELLTSQKNVPDEIMYGFLFVGNSRCAGDERVMRSLDIHRYLCVAEELECPEHVLRQSKNSDEGISSCSIKFKQIPMRDAEVQSSLFERFNEAFHFIREAKKARERILVYCREGKSRSATIVIAYAMKYFNMSYDEALTFVRINRRGIEPNLYFCRQLQLFGTYLSTGQLPESESKPAATKIFNLVPHFDDGSPLSTDVKGSPFGGSTVPITPSNSAPPTPSHSILLKMRQMLNEDEDHRMLMSSRPVTPQVDSSCGTPCLLLSLPASVKRNEDE